MFRVAAPLVFVSLAGVLAALALACGTDARGIDTCRRVEEARCKRATACGVDLGYVRHPGTSEADAIDGCVRYYRDACLHGLVADEPGETKLQACTSAIASGTCDVVKAPEISPACGWLIPPAATPAADAAADTAPAADAATD